MDNRKLLYKDFLENKNVYNLNVGYWRQKLERHLSEVIDKDKRPIANKMESGENFYDGNPIFSYLSPSKQKAIRIIQENPNDVIVYPEVMMIDAWIGELTIFQRERDSYKVPELVISLYLTQDTVTICLRIVKDWVDGRLNKEFIDSYFL